MKNDLTVVHPLTVSKNCDTMLFALVSAEVCREVAKDPEGFAKCFHRLRQDLNQPLLLAKGDDEHPIIITGYASKAQDRTGLMISAVLFAVRAKDVFGFEHVEAVPSPAEASQSRRVVH